MGSEQTGYFGIIKSDEKRRISLKELRRELNEIYEDLDEPEKNKHYKRNNKKHN
jgi:hypothetical protein